jgi:flagellar assembly protein FliH
LRDVAFEEARQQGYNLGLAQAESCANEARQLGARLDELLQAAAKPLALLDAQTSNEIVQLALMIGKQLARRELRVDPSQVAAIVRDSVALLPANARDVRVVVHPKDAQVLRDCLTETRSDRAWTLLEDPMLSRGSCRVESEYSRIDARFESRVAAIASQLFDDDTACGGPPTNQVVP